MANLTNRVEKLEDEQKSITGDIHDIKKDVSHIEQEIDEMKDVMKSNTEANTKTSATLTDIHIIMSEWKGQGKGIKATLIVLVSLIGLIGTIAGIKFL